MTRTEAIETIAHAASLADEGGTIQAYRMTELTYDPRRHTTTTLRTVAQWLADESGEDADELIESTW